MNNRFGEKSEMDATGRKQMNVLAIVGRIDKRWGQSITITAY